jgi:hypothetical protein
MQPGLRGVSGAGRSSRRPTACAASPVAEAGRAKMMSTTPRDPSSEAEHRPLRGARPPRPNRGEVESTTASELAGAGGIAACGGESQCMPKIRLATRRSSRR